MTGFLHKIATWGKGYPLLLGALVIGFFGAIMSGIIPNMQVTDPETNRKVAAQANQWWFIICFLIDIALVLIFIFFNKETTESSPLRETAGEEAATSSEPSAAQEPDSKPTEEPETSHEKESEKVE